MILSWRWNDKKYSWGAGQSTGEKKAVTKRVQ